MPSFNAILAFTAIALVALSAGPVQANALAADRAQVARHAHAHNAVAKRKRSDSSSPSASGRCKPRPSSSIPIPTPTPTPTSTPIPAPDTTTTTTTSPPPPATTSSSSSSPAPSPTNVDSSNSGRKMGLAWANDNEWLENFATRPRVGFLYSWSPDLPSTLGQYPYIQGMAMLHDDSQISDFENKVVPGYAHIALAHNEPNEPKSYVSPQQAVDDWWKYIDHLNDEGYLTISPACTDDDAGWAWYQEFFKLCTGCRIGAIAFHAYTPSAQHLIDYANGLHDTYGLDVYITEFACTNFSGVGGQPSMDEIFAYAGQVISFVDNTSWLKGAFPFGAVTDLQGVAEGNSLINGGNPTSLAYTYFG